MKHKLFLGIAAISGILTVIVAIYILPRSPWWPQDTIELSLPYDQDNPPIGMEPMGETINHPKPDVPLGHPGIDFQWNKKVKILASASGTVVAVDDGESGNVATKNVDIRQGKYLVEYHELDELAPEIKKGAKVAVGQLIGYPHAPKINGLAGEHRQLHWSFGYAWFFGEPLCPMNYFEGSSKQRIESDWEKANYSARSKFPDICSGDFKNRHR